MFGPLGLSLAPIISKNKSLTKFLAPIGQFYANAMGHRKYGLKYDDLRECGWTSDSLMSTRQWVLPLARMVASNTDPENSH